MNPQGQLGVVLASPRDLSKSAEVGAVKNGAESAAYIIRTKSARCGGLETNGPRERISGPDGLAAVRRFVREAHGYWVSMRARKAAQNVGRVRTGGGSATGIQRSPKLV